MFQTIEQVIKILETPEPTTKQLQALVDNPNFPVSELKTIYRFSGIENEPIMIHVITGEENHNDNTFSWHVKKTINEICTTITVDLYYQTDNETLTDSQLSS